MYFDVAPLRNLALSRWIWMPFLLSRALPVAAQVPAEINISFQKVSATAEALQPTVAPLSGGPLVEPSHETWNLLTTELTGLSPAGIPLQLSNGAASGTTLSATIGYAHDSNGLAWTNKDDVMMDAWVGVKGTEYITLANLPTSFTTHGYTLFIHGDSNSTSRPMSYTVGGRTLHINDTFTFSGDHAPAMLTFGNLTASTITIQGNDAAQQRSAVNALRLVPNPPVSLHIAFQKTAGHRDALADGNAPVATGSIVDPSRTTWNAVTTHVDGYTPTDRPLQWADGTTSPVTLTAAFGYAHESNANVAPGGLADKDAVLFDAWAGLKGTEFITLEGLPDSLTERGYQLILYGDANAVDRTMSYTVNGHTQILEDTSTYAGDPKPFSLTWRNLTAATLTVTGNNAAASRSAVNGLRILPNDIPVQPAITRFRAESQYVQPGTEVLLSWTVDHTDSLSIDGGIGDVIPVTTNGSGSVAYTVHTDTTLTLTASNTWSASFASLDLRTGPPRPNLVVILIDDMGMMDSSEPFAWDGDGSPILHPTMPYRTPQMERMADLGMKFPAAYAMSVCSPTRTCIMTGKNSVRHGVTDWVSGSLQSNGQDTNQVLDPPPDWSYQGVLGREILLTTLLADAGYRNLMVGKTHWGSVGNNPFDAGFHRAVGYASGSDKLNYFSLPGMAGYQGTGTYVTEALTREANSLMAEAVQDGVPFYTYVSHFAVHTPHQLDPRFAANYPTLSGNALNYATMIEGIDRSLGDILDQLDTLGVAENTLVVFLGDNGSDAPIGSNNSLPLRGKKGTEWEGGSRVPFLVAWANPDPANPFQQQFSVLPDTVEHELVTVYDLFPTLLEVAGIPFTHAIDGYSLVPYLAGTPGTHRPQEHLLHYPHDHRGEYYSTLRQDGWKLLFDYENTSYQLYHLAADPGETTDLAGDQPARTMSMARRMAVLLHDAGALWPVTEADGLTRFPYRMPLLPEVDLDEDLLPDNQEDPNRNGRIDPGETDPDNADSDHDRTPDGSEIRLGLDPLDPQSAFQVSSARGPAGRFQLTWPSAPGTRFDIHSSYDLTRWDPLASDHPADPGTTTQYTISPPLSMGPRLYRIQLRPDLP